MPHRLLKCWIENVTLPKIRERYNFNSYIVLFIRFRYQDIHTQAYIMVFATQRWLGVRLDCLSAVLTGAAALAAVFVSQDAGKCI